MPDAARFRVRGANTVTRRDEATPPRRHDLKSLRFSDLVADRDNAAGIDEAVEGHPRCPGERLRRQSVPKGDAYVAVVLEDAESEFMVHFPDLPGCFTRGAFPRASASSSRHPRPNLSLRGRNAGAPLREVRFDGLARARNAKPQSHRHATRASGRDLGSPEAMALAA